MTTDTVGGVWRYSTELIRALSDFDVEFVLAAIGEPLDESQEATVASLSNVEFFSFQGKLEWMQDPWSDIEQIGPRLKELAEDRRVDLVHLNDYSYGSLEWPCGVIMVTHSCVYSWHQALRKPITDEWKEYHYRVGAGLQRANVVVSPTYAMLHSVEQIYASLKRKHVIFNGIDPALFALKNELLDAKQNFVLTAGRLWDEAKNVQLLSLVAGDCDWPIFAIGAMRCEGGGSCSVTGLKQLDWLPSNELASWMQRAAVYCMPAKYEPFGLSVVEAGLAHCALVLGDIPSLRELWENAAIFIDPFDSASLKESLRLLQRDETLRRSMQVAAFARARQYSLRRMAEAYHSLYRTVQVMNRDELLKSEYVI